MSYSDETLVAELHRLGVRHLARFSATPAACIAPMELLTALAAHPQARLRAALILLFLRQPEMSQALLPALAQLTAPAAQTLKLYYQAAAYLQRELATDLQPAVKPWFWLPDYFSLELNATPLANVKAEPGGSAAALQALGEIHQRLSGQAYNWAGTYRQNITLFLKQLKTHAYIDSPTTAAVLKHNTTNTEVGSLIGSYVTPVRGKCKCGTAAERNGGGANPSPSPAPKPLCPTDTFAGRERAGVRARRVAADALTLPASGVTQ
jgi:hypothetical protein